MAPGQHDRLPHILKHTGLGPKHLLLMAPEMSPTRFWGMLAAQAETGLFLGTLP